MCQKTACFQFVIFNYSIKKQLEISKIREHFILNTKYIDFFYASISKKKRCHTQDISTLTVLLNEYKRTNWPYVKTEFPPKMKQISKHSPNMLCCQQTNSWMIQFGFCFYISKYEKFFLVRNSFTSVLFAKIIIEYTRFLF